MILPPIGFEVGNIKIILKENWRKR